MLIKKMGHTLDSLTVLYLSFVQKMTQPMTFCGIRFAPVSIPFSRRLQTFAVWQWIMTVLVLPILCTVVLIWMLLTPLFPISVAYLCWIYFFDWRTPRTGGRRWQWVRNWRIWQFYRDYFPVSLEKTADLEPTKNYLIGYHPHGIIGCGAFCNFATEATGFSKIYPGIKPYLLTLRSQFYWPFLRAYILATGICDVTVASLKWILSKKEGGNAAIVVIGGAEEALNARPGSYSLTLKNRKGFVRVAILNGAQLVPCFSFGENELFKQADNPEGSFIRRIQEFVKKRVGVSPPIFYGRGIFNYSIGILPFRQPIHTVVGAPIEVKQNPQPSPEEINSLHQKYIQALSDLFDDHKEKYGISADKHLIFV